MIYPVLIDSRPRYMAAAPPTASLLLAPVDAGTLISILADSVAAGGPAPIVLSTFPPTPDYRADIERACPEVAEVAALADFQPAGRFEASDWLLFIDARYWPHDRHALAPMLRDPLRARGQATHLVAMARHAGGTSERIEFAADGRVRRIQRFYDAVTWPYLTAVACSLVSVACLRHLSTEPPCTGLTDLRVKLMSQGVPCRDVPLDGAVFDLDREDDLLRLNERTMLEAARSVTRGGRVSLGRRGVVHPTASIVGPVIIQAGARVDEGVVIVGPTVIGTGARIKRHAVVAQSVIASGTEVGVGAVVRSRALFSGDEINLAEPLRSGGSVPEPGSGLSVEHEDAGRAVYPRVKAFIEASTALLGIILLSPLFALIALLVKLDSRGPVLFADLREGQHGRLFRCFKFRTMVTGSEARQRELLGRNDVDGPQFKLEKDPRLTRLGRWLRPASLDELPQLFNVVRGEMSLIGPRPSPFRENQTCVPWRDARLSVRPGITGLWQVCRHDRRDGDFHQWVYFDLLYVQHMSFMVDLKVLLATVLTRGGQSHVALERIITKASVSP